MKRFKNILSVREPGHPGRLALEPVVALAEHNRARLTVPGFFMGNTAETILEQIHSSVLAIKPPGFVTPVTLED